MFIIVWTVLWYVLCFITPVLFVIRNSENLWLRLAPLPNRELHTCGMFRPHENGSCMGKLHKLNKRMMVLDMT